MDKEYTMIEISAEPNSLKINGIDVLPLYRKIDDFAANLPEGSMLVMFAALANRIAEAAAMADRGLEVSGKSKDDTMLDAVLEMIRQSYYNFYNMIDDAAAASIQPDAGTRH